MWTIVLQNEDCGDIRTCEGVMAGGWYFHELELRAGMKILRFLDPFGMLYVNRFQYDDLLDDLEKLGDFIEPGLKAEVIEMVRESRESPDTYIRFDGD